MFLVFGKCRFLLHWKNVLSVSHPLHLRFSQNKSVTHMVISANRLFIMRYISGKHAFSSLHFWYPYSHCLAPLPHIQIARASRGREDKFCHRITKFCTFLAHLSRRLIGELIVYPWSGVRRPSASVVVIRRPQCLNIFFSETAWPIKTKFYVEPPWVGGTKFCSRHLGHMTKMAATPIYGKNPSKIFFSRTAGPIFSKLGM